MNFAREGIVFIVIAAFVAAGAYAIALNRRSWPLWLLAFFLTVMALWVAYFFRDPERSGARGPQVVIAPADGKVVLINEVNEPTFMGGKAKRMSIFMNVFNVHVNRYPITGTVRYFVHNPGKFLNAAADKASTENEQASVGLETARAASSSGRSPVSSRGGSSPTARSAKRSRRAIGWASSASAPAWTSSFRSTQRST